MIDIHSHILFGVDDGAKTRQESIAMLQIAAEQGICGIITTPHYRHGMFSYPKEKIEEHFLELKKEAERAGIRLYLGTEQHVNSMTLDYLENGRCHTLADSNYVLAEYKHDTEFGFIKSSVQELIFHDYIPIIAHVERYACMADVKNVGLLRDIGAMIQVNADSVIGKAGLRMKGYCKKLLKLGLVDFVASDAHGVKERRCNMGKCAEYLYKKYDRHYVDAILSENAEEILASQKLV